MTCANAPETWARIWHNQPHSAVQTRDNVGLNKIGPSTCSRR
jgi:hypothetical protein